MGSALVMVGVLVALAGADARADAAGSAGRDPRRAWVTLASVAVAIAVAAVRVHAGARVVQRDALRPESRTRGTTTPERDRVAASAGGAARSAGPAGRATVVHLVTSGASLTVLDGQASYLCPRGFEVRVVSPPRPDLEAFAEREGVIVSAVPMSPRQGLIRDALAVLRLWRVIATARATVVHAHAPAGGLIGMLAAWLARTPARFYELHTLRLRDATGARRVLLWLTEWVTCALAHRVLAPSVSLRSSVIAEGLCPTAKIQVLADGGGEGVDATTQFHPLPLDVRRATRRRLGIPEDAVVLGFVGRLAHDEGIADLDAAFRRLREEDRRLHLLLVATGHPEDPPPGAFAWALRGEPRVHVTGVAPDLASHYAAMDVLALPAHREGSFRVPLEAAAMSLPTVATRVSGSVDAVVDGRTGLLVPPRDPPRLTQALARYVADPALRAAHGDAARRRVMAAYQRERIWDALVTEYRSVLQASGADAVHARSTEP